MGPICNDRATNKGFVPPSALFPEILVFGIWTLCLVLGRRGGCFGRPWDLLRSPGGSSIPPVGHPTTTLSHLPSFPDGQSHRQTLQLPALVTMSSRALLSLSCSPWETPYGEHVWVNCGTRGPLPPLAFLKASFTCSVLPCGTRSPG